MKFLFLGTADFGIPALDRMIERGHSCVGVVTNPPKPAGRGLKLRKTPVHLHCEENNIAPVLTPESLKDEHFLQEVRELDADVFVVVAFSILPEVLFSIPEKGTFNIHAALLPLFRGPAPIHRAIETGASETGVTLFRIDRGVDTGSILVQLSCKISAEETTPSLYERLSNLGANALEKGISLLENNEDTYTKQDHSSATKAPLLHKSEGKISWESSATEIYNRLRAFKPFPGCFTESNGKRYGVEWAEVVMDNSAVKAGTIITHDKEGIVVKCGENALKITQIKPAGKRVMSVADFVNGSPMTKGTILE